jgi:hypothetical protein
MPQRCSVLLAFFIAVSITGIGEQTAYARGHSPRIAWDWSGIIGTGQSLSVGAQGRPIISTSQPYGNLKLSTGNLPWPIDPNDPSLAMTPLVEPVGRQSQSYPSSWPTNIDGETYHTSMADELSALVQADLHRDFVSVHSEVGEDGQGMVFLKKDAVPKGVNGHSYQAAVIETTAIARLARAAHKTYGVAAVVVTHGETDCGNKNYEAELRTLRQNYDFDLRAITGQKEPILMILSQQNSILDFASSTNAQWQIGLDDPAHIVCSGPKYQYPYAGDTIHLTNEGYRQLGEKYAQVYYERVILGRKWEPLEPVKIHRRGAVVTVDYHVPVPPLTWDDSMEPPHQAVDEWKLGKGFEVRAASGAKVGITSVDIKGNSVVIRCATDPGSGARIGYAMAGATDPRSTPQRGTKRWGLLKDSDPFKGAVTGTPQPNYALAFDVPIH